jgi:hypothetical protein
VVWGTLVLGLLSASVANAAPAPRRQARIAARILCEARGVPCRGERLGAKDGGHQSSAFVKQTRRLLHRPSGTWLGRSRTRPLGGSDLVALQNGAAVGGADDPRLLTSLEPLGLLAPSQSRAAVSGSVTPRSPRGPPAVA